MRWFLDLSTRAKLFLAVGIMILSLGLVEWVSYRGLRTMQASEEELYEKQFQNVRDVRTVRARENAIRADLYEILADKNPSHQQALYKEINDNNQDSSDAVANLLSRNQDISPFSARLREFDTIRTQYHEVRDSQVLPLIQQGKTEPALQLMVGDQRERNSKLKALADELAADAETEAEAAITQSRQICQVPSGPCWGLEQSPCLPGCCSFGFSTEPSPRRYSKSPVSPNGWRRAT
jgi:hypothetical protein